jgi:hypothetical protein
MFCLPTTHQYHHFFLKAEFHLNSFINLNHFKLQNATMRFSCTRLPLVVIPHHLLLTHQRTLLLIFLSVISFVFSNHQTMRILKNCALSSSCTQRMPSANCFTSKNSQERDVSLSFLFWCAENKYIKKPWVQRKRVNLIGLHYYYLPH